MANIDYKTTDDKMNDYSALPAGEYIAYIKSDEVKTTKTGSKMLVLQWEVLEGQYKGRVLFDNLNLWHSNQQAKAIAQGAMNAICQAAGFPDGVKDSGQLHRKAMVLKLAVKTDPQYGDQNTIKKYSPINGNQAKAAAPQSEVPQTQKKNPWD